MTTQSPAIRSQSRKIGKFVKIMAQTFLNCESTGDFTNIPALIYHGKTEARPFDTIHDILRSLSLLQTDGLKRGSRMKFFNLFFI